MRQFTDPTCALILKRRKRNSRALQLKYLSPSCSRKRKRARCDEFLKLGSRFVAIFNFESTESASFSFHSKLRDRKWRKSEGPTIVPGAVFGCEEDCVLDRKEIEIDATRALRKRPLRREDV